MSATTSGPSSRLLSTQEAAGELGVCVDTIFRWFSEGRLSEAVPPARGIPRMFERSEVERLRNSVRGRRNRGLDLTRLADDAFRERFWSKVDKNGPVPARCPELGQCWIWVRSAAGQGYGRFTVSKGWPATAHMVSYALEIAPVPPGAHTCHRCDNPPCVRPEHLFIGSAADNARDMFSKGRQGPRYRGSAKPGARLTEEDVKAIRAVPYYYGRNRALARQYGVSDTTIRKVIDGQKWGHVA